MDLSRPIGRISLKRNTFCQADKRCFFSGGRGWIRTIEAEKQQIYSLPPLATRELSHIKLGSVVPKTEVTGQKRNRRFIRLLRSITKKWSWWTDLNPRPADYKSAALPTELHQQFRALKYYNTISRQCQYHFSTDSCFLIKAPLLTVRVALFCPQMEQRASSRGGTPMCRYKVDFSEIILSRPDGARSGLRRQKCDGEIRSDRAGKAFG